MRNTLTKVHLLYVSTKLVTSRAARKSLNRKYRMRNKIEVRYCYRNNIAYAYERGVLIKSDVKKRHDVGDDMMSFSQKDFLERLEIPSGIFMPINQDNLGLFVKIFYRNINIKMHFCILNNIKNIRINMQRYLFLFIFSSCIYHI